MTEMNIAWTYPAALDGVSLVLNAPEDHGSEGDGRSGWKWCRFANGDLALIIFPHGDTYMGVSEGPSGRDYAEAFNNGDLSPVKASSDDLAKLLDD